MRGLCISFFFLFSLPRGNRVHTNEVLSGGSITPQRIGVLRPPMNGEAFLHFSTSLFLGFLFTSTVGRRVLLSSGWLASYSGSVGGACINNYSFFFFHLSIVVAWTDSTEVSLRLLICLVLSGVR